jgi:hypothetical protein
LKVRATKSFIKAGLLCIALFFFISSCKKKRAFNEEDAQSTVDNRMAQGENDEALKDVEIAIMEQYLLRGRGTGSPDSTTSSSLCGVAVDTTQILNGIVRLNYNGVACYGKKRTGTIQVTIQGYPLKKWKHAGCVVKVDFLAYQVTRISDGKKIQLDGTQNITNISGDTWFELWYLNTRTLVHTVTGNNLKLTYDGSSSDVAIMNVNRRATYTFLDNVTTCKIEGLGVYDGKSNLGSWGQTRDGAQYTCEVVTPVVWKTACGAVAPVSGEVSINIDGKEYELKCLYGVDKEGNSVSNENECPYGWKVSWSRKKKTNTRIFGYY